MFDTDVFILGGGPAGLAAAIAARRAGFRVILADAKQPPIDKACGEGLMPDSLAAAASLGINIPRSAGSPFRGISFQGAGSTVAADFPSGTGLGVRRTALQTLLIEHAQQAGVEMFWGYHVAGLDRNNVVTTQNRIRARWIVGADGAQSSVRRWAGLQSFRRNSQRFSYRRHYRVTPWSDYVEIHWGERCQFYVTPVNEHEVSLVLMTRNPHQRIAQALPLFPTLASRLRGCDPVNSERGALAATRRLRRITHDNVALIGDASGTVDPITGEGICLAFHQAVALGDALSRGDLRHYECTHARISRRPQFMADLMLLMDRSALLRQRTLRVLEVHPYLFSNLLAMHVGQLTPVRVAATAAVLSWGVITP